MRQARLLLVAMAVLQLLACQQSPPVWLDCPDPGSTEASARVSELTADSEEISLANLSFWVTRLSEPEFRGRHASSSEADRVAGLLAREMMSLGLASPSGTGLCQSFPVDEAAGFNVVGHAPAGTGGSGVVLVSAHYDGQGMHPAGLLYPGADDNASGVAALLEVARLTHAKQWPFELVFLASGAEETGHLGARAWVSSPSIELAELLLSINFDMVGRAWPGIPATAIGYRLQGQGKSRFEAQLAAASAAANIEIRRLAEPFKSDSNIFGEVAAALDFSTGLHQDHHERTDTPEKVSIEQIARSVRLTMSLLNELAGQNGLTR